MVFLALDADSASSIAQIAAGNDRGQGQLVWNPKNVYVTDWSRHALVFRCWGDSPALPVRLPSPGGFSLSVAGKEPSAESLLLSALASHGLGDGEKARRQLQEAIAEDRIICSRLRRLTG